MRKINSNTYTLQTDIAKETDFDCEIEIGFTKLSVFVSIVKIILHSTIEMVMMTKRRMRQMIY